MLRFADDLRVYLHREPIDFRCGINTCCTCSRSCRNGRPTRM